MNDILLKLVDMSLMASLLIVTIIIIRGVFKRIPRKYICILWALVAIRLICPINIESSFSIFNVTNNNLEYKNNAYIENIVKPRNNPANTINDKKENVINNKKSQNANIPKKNSDVSNSNTTSTVKLENDKDIKNTSIVTWIWILGVAIIITYGLISYWILKRKIRAAIMLENNVYICDDIDSPFILGIISPKIYIHSGLEKESYEYIVKHEKAHIGRKDYIWKPLGLLLLSIYWFNPICWIAYIMLCKDIELACDEKVISKMNDEDIALYSESLLKCSIRRRNITVCPIAFGEVGVKVRIKNALNYKKPKTWIHILSVVICITILILFMTNSVSNKTSKEHMSEIKTSDENSLLENQDTKTANTEFWKDGNIFIADLKRNDEDEEGYITKKCVGIITETDNNIFNITIRCDFKDYYDNIDLGNYKVEKNKILKVPSYSQYSSYVLVWSKEDVKDNLEENEKGYHSSISIKDDIVKSFFYNNQVETGYYEHNYFNLKDKYKSLVAFESGFGAERDLVEITNIELTNQDFVELRNGVGTGTYYSTFYDVENDRFSEAYYWVVAVAGNMIVYMKDNNQVGVTELFANKKEKVFKPFKSPKSVAVPIDILEKEPMFISNYTLKFWYYDKNNKVQESEIYILDESNDNEKDGTTSFDKVTLNINNKSLLKVLKNEEKLYCIQTGREMYFKEYNYSDFMMVNDDGKYEYDLKNPEVYDNFEIGWISIVDMDQDGTDEVILYEKTQGIRIILRSFNDKVYLYSFPFRQMKSISTKGEFDGSSSAATTYVGKIKFEGLNCYYIQTCLLDLYQKKGNRYKIGNKKVSKKEVEEYLINSGKEQVDEYEYKSVVFE